MGHRLIIPPVPTPPVRGPTTSSSSWVSNGAGNHHQEARSLHDDIAAPHKAPQKLPFSRVPRAGPCSPYQSPHGPRDAVSRTVGSYPHSQTECLHPHWLEQKCRHFNRALPRLSMSPGFPRCLLLMNASASAHIHPAAGDYYTVTTFYSIVTVSDA